VFIPSLKFDVTGDFADPLHYIEIWWIMPCSDASIQVKILGATYPTRASILEEGRTDPKDALGTIASKNLVPQVFDISLKKGKKYFIRVQAFRSTSTTLPLVASVLRNPNVNHGKSVQIVKSDATFPPCLMFTSAGQPTSNWNVQAALFFRRR
jgi:hypothetical protein